MNIQPISQNTFKGYDARPLKGFLMSSNCYGIADEMHNIGKKEGFRIYSTSSGRFENKCAEIVPPYSETGSIWAQDYWTIVKDKLLTLEENETAQSILKFFNLKFDSTQKSNREAPKFMPMNRDFLKFLSVYASATLNERMHIPGGNIFIVKDGNKDTVLVGKDELKKYDKEDIQTMYNAENVIVLPQMDCHLDLFIRPLDKKRVLLADDKMTVDILNKGLNKLQLEDSKEADGAYNTMHGFTRNFQSSIDINNHAQADEVEEILEANGFNVIRVPGRVYETQKNNFLKQYCNFINANAFLNSNGELVYITNKSNINEHLGLTPELSEKIGFDFEQEFVISISKYVKPEHIYFVDGNKNFVSKTMLTRHQGGIHCACSEIPF